MKVQSYLEAFTQYLKEGSSAERTVETYGYNLEKFSATETCGAIWPKCGVPLRKSSAIFQGFMKWECAPK